MKLKSRRSVITIQRDGYQEVQPTEGCELLTPAEWDEFCARAAKENNLRLVSESRKRVEANHTAFEAGKALTEAQAAHRPHSLIASQRTWQLQATIPGVCQAWGYAYENGQFNR